MTASELAAKTEDAYSVERYASWRACAALLLKRGYSTGKAESILRSKVMRWAADCSTARYGHVSARAVSEFLDSKGGQNAMRGLGL